MKTFYLYTHLGLGDIIICNGLIREVCKKYPHITIFCKPEYFLSVKYMLRDISNLEILKGNDINIQNLLQNIPNTEKYYVGHHNIQNFLNKYTFDECFYRQIGLNFDKRWSSFYIERDIKEEEKVFNELAPKTPYIFVHDDFQRNFALNNTYFDKTLTVFRPPKIDNIFLYCKIIEQASEIHCMDSCFKHIVDSLPIKHEKLFYHLYVRGINNSAYAQSKLNWKKILQ